MHRGSACFLLIAKADIEQDPIVVSKVKLLLRI